MLIIQNPKSNKGCYTDNEPVSHEIQIEQFLQSASTLLAYYKQSPSQWNNIGNMPPGGNQRNYDPLAWYALQSTLALGTPCDNGHPDNTDSS